VGSGVVAPPTFPFGTGWGSNLWPCHSIPFESFSTVWTCELVWTLWRRETVCIMCWELNHDCKDRDKGQLNCLTKENNIELQIILIYIQQDATRVCCG